MDLQLKEELVKISTNRDYLINRAASAILDPHQHAYEHGEHPFLDNKCARCHQPRADHWGLLRRLVGRLLRWR